MIVFYILYYQWKNTDTNYTSEHVRIANYELLIADVIHRIDLTIKYVQDSRNCFAKISNLL